MRSVAVIVAVALLSSACGSAPTSPVAPTVSRTPDATFVVSGYVVGAGGVPLVGAEVRVAGRSDVTDFEGYYSLAGVPKSYGAATAVKAGFRVAREILTVSSDTRFDFNLGAPEAIYTLSGVVVEMTPNGFAPVEGVEVTAYSCEDVKAAPPFFSDSCPVLITRTVRTDARGNYKVSGLYSGKANIVNVSKMGFYDPRTAPNEEEGSGEPVTLNGNTQLDLLIARR